MKIIKPETPKLPFAIQIEEPEVKLLIEDLNAHDENEGLTNVGYTFLSMLKKYIND